VKADWNLIVRVENLMTGADNHGVGKWLRQYRCLADCGDDEALGRFVRVEAKLRAWATQEALRRTRRN
jgi:hypothetical protein